MFYNCFHFHFSPPSSPFFTPPVLLPPFHLPFIRNDDFNYIPSNIPIHLSLRFSFIFSPFLSSSSIEFIFHSSLFSFLFYDSLSEKCPFSLPLFIHLFFSSDGRPQAAIGCHRLLWSRRRMALLLQVSFQATLNGDTPPLTLLHDCDRIERTRKKWLQHST